jgi:hypothetical protein
VKKCDRVTPHLRQSLHTVFMVKPISLRIRSADAAARARELLRSLDEKDQLRRNVKHQSLKALIAVREMRSNAVKLEVDRRWLAEVQSIETMLQKLGKTGSR